MFTIPSTTDYTFPATPDIDRWEQIDASRQGVLLNTCRPRAVELYKKLLNLATIEYSPEQGAVAVLVCPTIRALAQWLRGSYDVILRYISIFKALGLVQHFTSRKKGTHLYLPLGPYRPLTSFAALNNLILSRRYKLGQLADQAMRLYIKHYGDPERHIYPTTTIQQLKATCEQLLQGPLNQESIQLLHTHVASLVACFQDPSQRGDLTALKGDPKGKAWHTCSYQTGDLETQKGDFYAMHSEERAPIEDLNAPGRSPQGDPSSQKGDPSASQATSAPEEEGLCHKKGDFYAAKRRPVHKKGDFYTSKRRPIHKKGDFYVPKEDFYAPPELKKETVVEKVETQVLSVSINDIGNDNNKLLSSSCSNDPVIDSEMETFLKNSPSARRQPEAEQIRKEALALAIFVENTPRNLASFISKLSKNPLATRAAIIDLLVQTYQPDYRASRAIEAPG
ncbi:hypothetical protein [Dictyobacter kobayashii]|uniref:Uncharacterized protein n=1 Tax=Dictyobacter kobayashii TaxID=2014872 RepID=A0A402AYJ9_9CHLR|nr:hypothetical protein [Dictyobacter kobayashii]GCE24190.1 hypothetical protein KDK_79900 [Dictyobacter kobayashii]